MTNGRLDPADAPLFIVDNTPGGRDGLQYLREWSELAKSIDIATGYFEIGSLLDPTLGMAQYPADSSLGTPTRAAHAENHWGLCRSSGSLEVVERGALPSQPDPTPRLRARGSLLCTELHLSRSL